MVRVDPPIEAYFMTDSGTFLQSLNRRLDAAAASVMPLARAGKLDEAEKAIFAIDRDIYGQLAAARMYVALIRSLGGAAAHRDDFGRIRSLFDRAVRLREAAYPMAHTEEEGERYQEGSAQERSRMVEELGFDPHR